VLLFVDMKAARRAAFAGNSAGPLKRADAHALQQSERQTASPNFRLFEQKTGNSG
jgi:hypothetical protein